MQTSPTSRIGRSMNLRPRWCRWAALWCVVAVSACGGEGGGSGTPPAAFTLTLDSTTLTVGQGREALLGVKLTRSPGFSDEVQVALNQAPAGVSSGTLVFTGSLSEASLPVRVGAQTAAGTVHSLDVKASSGTLSQSVSGTLTVGVALPYSQRLIADARAAGRLDEGTALLYRVYALFGDRRLPDTYRGAGSLQEDNEVFDEIRARWPALPTAMQDSLRPFIVRPSDQLSVWNAPPATTTTATSAAPRASASSARKTRAALSPASCPPQSAGSWISKRSTSHAVRAWAQCRGSPNTDLESEIDIDIVLTALDVVYPSMTALMVRPVPDLDGDDDAIDFYIVDNQAYVFRLDRKLKQPTALAVAYSDAPWKANGGNGSSGFVLMPRSLLAVQGFQSVVIHEFFHVLQKGHNWRFGHRTEDLTDAKQKHWFVEASAQWAEAHFDRKLAPGRWTRRADVFVHSWFKNVFQSSIKSLNAYGDGSHDYGAYIWPYFVEQETGGREFMGQIWFNLRGATSFEAADDLIDTAYPFSKNFKRFALRNLNTDLQPGDPIPQDKRHVKLDPEQFPDREVPKFPLQLTDTTLRANQAHNMNLEVKNLSAVYLDLLNLGGGGSGIQQVTVDTSGLQPGGSLDVQALIENDDGWVSIPVDLSAKELFCFDEGPSTASVRGSFQRIILVLSNHAKRLGDSISGEIRVLPKSAPCAPVWSGSIHHRDELTTPAGTINVVTTTSVVFEFDDTAPADAGAVEYRVRSGMYNFRAVYNNIGCRTVVTAVGAIPLQPYRPGVPGTTAASLSISSGLREYLGGGLSVVEHTEISDCNDRHVDETRTYISDLRWWAMDKPGNLSFDGNVLERAYDFSDPNFDHTVHWDERFERQRR